ncbi:MAG TPA: toll/interleukin-1 receptor domain-containing protein [Burkholderiales bacterium]|nr:toll/interleukin-1 receptor domain-containing protein [Burkholderiales bacterium]
MAFVPGCEHDVFVSYAHIDNEPLSGAPQGWISTFVRDVESVVRRKLFDRPKDFDVWVDHELAGNRPFSADIQRAVGNTASLLVIMSPAYLASDWCRREREAFRAQVQDKVRAGSRVFVVELDRIEDSGRVPPEFSDLLRHRLWIEDGPARTPRTLGLPVPTPAEPEYYSRVNQLALEIAQELQRLAEAGAGAAAAPGGPVVFLAEVTDDLESRREEVRRYLGQMGLRVLPASYYPRDDAKAFEQAMAADLARSKLFVQLLSNVAGRKPAAAPSGFPALQAGLAKDSGLPVLQWRARELDLAAVEDTAQRELLQGASVRACGIEEFKEAVVDEARREPPQAKPRPASDVLLFLDTDATDRALAERIGKFLYTQGIGYSMALQEGSPEDIRKDLEDNLRECDGLMLVYGAASLNWVRSKLRWCRKIVSQRSEPPVALAVFEGSPHDQAGIGIEIPGWQWIDCRAGKLDDCLRNVVQGVKG